MTTAAELVVKVSADTASAERDLRSFSARVLGGGGIMGSAAGTFTGMLGAQVIGGAVRGVQQLGGAAVGVMGNIIDAGMTFEAQMDAVGAVLGGTDSEIQALTAHAQAIALNPNLVADAEAAGEAMYVLATGGLTATEIMGGATEASILLANATGSGIPEAAETAIKTMTMFNVPAQDMIDMVSGITGVTNASTFSLTDFAYFMTNAAGTAATLGMSLDDVNQAAAMTAPYFSTGRTAGTAFERFLLGLNPATDAATAAMQELGLITEEGTNRFYDQSGSLVDLSSQYRLVNQAFGGLTDKQASALARDIWGVEGMQTALAMMRITEEQYAQTQGVLGDTSAIDMAAERTDNLKSAWAQLEDTITQGKISIFQGMEEPLQKVVRTVTPIIQLGAPVVKQIGMSVGDWLTNLIEPISARIPAAVEVFYSLTTSSIYGVGVSPIDAFKQAVSVALGTDVIKVGPANIDFVAGAITWGGQNAETFGGYAVESLWAALKRNLSGEAGPSLGTRLAESTLDWLGVEELEKDGLSRVAALSVGLGTKLYEGFDAAMESVDAADTLDRWSQNLQAGLGLAAPTEGAQIVAPVTITPRVEVADLGTGPIKDMLATEIAPPVIASIAASEPIQATVPIDVSGVTMQQVAEDLPRIVHAAAALQSQTMTPLQVDIPIIPAPVVQEGPAPLFPTSFDFAPVDPIEVTVPVEPIYVPAPSAQTIDAAIRDLSFIGGTGAVGGGVGMTVPVQAQITSIDPGQAKLDYIYSAGAAITSSPAWGTYTNTYGASAAITGEPEWGSFTHEYSVTARVTWVNGGGGPPGAGGGAAGGGGPMSAEATGTLGSQGGWSLVGERGPEMVRLPFASRVWSAQDTAAMAGERGPQVVIYAQVNSPADEESLARRIERRLKRGY